MISGAGEEFAAIRVKTKTSGFTVFQWNAKPNGDIFLEMIKHHDFCMLVDTPENEDASPIYYTMPTQVIDKWLKDDFREWVTTPGAKGQQRAEDNKRRLFYVDDDMGKLGHGYRKRIATYKHAWKLLG